MRTATKKETRSRRRTANRRRRSVRSRVRGGGSAAVRSVGRFARARAGALIAIATAAAALCLGYLAYQWLTESDRFEVARISIYGADTISREDVGAALDLEVGDNLFVADLDAAAERLEAHPWIANATVQRRLPDRVVVEIEERKAAAVVELAGEYLATAEGVVFKRADRESGECRNMVTIRGLSRDAYLASPADTATRIRAAVAVVQLYRKRARPELAAVHVDARGSFALETVDEVMIRIGRGSDGSLPARLRSFDAAWRSLAADEKNQVRSLYVANSGAHNRVAVSFRDSTVGM